MAETVPIEQREQRDFIKDRKQALKNSLQDHEKNKERIDPKKNYVLVQVRRQSLRGKWE